ncbi:MAG: hypothetical protein HW421_3134 [Ignavibacteria bacterium]|nr:hypothetical protein [Ignavibacteria bacterium]
MENNEKYYCPHCKSELKKWLCPPESSWGVEFQYVCFNDDCNYYVSGWEWMKVQYSVKASYRHRFNPFNLEMGPLPVWSENAHKNQIVEPFNQNQQEKIENMNLVNKLV